MTSCAETDLPLVEGAWRLIEAIPDSPRFTWDFRYKRLCEKIISEGCLDNMLSWPTVCEALFAGQTNTARREFLSLPLDVQELAYDAPYPLMPAASPSQPSGTYIRQASMAHLISKVVPWRDLRSVYEIGGGYGALVVVLKRFGFLGEHYVLDHPVMNLIRDKVLSRLGLDTKPDPDAWSAYDVVIGVHSLCEIGVKERGEILDRVTARYCYAFSITKTYDGVDNVAWFGQWCDDRGLNYKYHDLPSDNQIIIIAG